MTISKTGGTDSPLRVLISGDITKPLRVLVCGGRNFGRVEQWEWGKYHADCVTSEDGDLLKRLHQHRFILNTLEVFAFDFHHLRNEPQDEYGNWLPNWVVISGMAKGADTVAIEWAVVNWCQWLEFPANWKEHGKRAGIIRNQQMLDEGKPDLVIAFPGGRGTRCMIRLAKEAGVPVREISYLADF